MCLKRVSAIKKNIAFIQNPHFMYIKFTFQFIKQKVC